MPVYYSNSTVYYRHAYGQPARVRVAVVAVHYRHAYRAITGVPGHYGWTAGGPLRVDVVAVPNSRAGEAPNPPLIRT